MLNATMLSVSVLSVLAPMGTQAGMGEIEKAFDLDKSHIGICSRDLNLNKSHIGLFKNSLFEVRNVENDESIQFDTNSQQYLFKKSQNNTVNCLSYQLAIIYF
jgi:hypothetical protein